MILTANGIINNIMQENITITPFRKEQLNPNSYNLRLHNELLIYDSDCLDSSKENSTTKIVIPEEGYRLEKGRLYLARTLEYTETKNFIPILNGRSSIGRLGLFIHVTAGFGDIGFKGFWTLELYPTIDLVVYPEMRICQIYYETPAGNIDSYYEGKYQNNQGIQSSMLHKEF
jgi:dCTP deaminase